MSSPLVQALLESMSSLALQRCGFAAASPVSFFAHIGIGFLNVCSQWNPFALSMSHCRCECFQAPSSENCLWRLLTIHCDSPISWSASDTLPFPAKERASPWLSTEFLLPFRTLSFSQKAIAVYFLRICFCNLLTWCSCSRLCDSVVLSFILFCVGDAQS